jgi:membrane protein involved in colicin uptake
MTDQKSYSMHSKGKKLASCTYSKKLGAWRLWSEATQYRTVEEGIEPKTAWESFRKEVTASLNITVKRGRPPKYTAEEKAAMAAEKAAAVAAKKAEKEKIAAAKKAEREAAKKAKPAKAPKKVAVAEVESMSARGQRELIAA